MTRFQALQKMKTMAAVIPNFAEVVATWLETGVAGSDDQRMLLCELANELRCLRADIIATRPVKKTLPVPVAAKVSTRKTRCKVAV